MGWNKAVNWRRSIISCNRASNIMSLLSDDRAECITATLAADLMRAGRVIRLLGCEPVLDLRGIATCFGSFAMMANTGVNRNQNNLSGNANRGMVLIAC